ncbi:unnamed protein product [Polarella glacialis]|uniref:Ubiquitin fusion degradation protein UFD1 N-terminal subdomain 2 domain-containing protein n=1 Tax=Polarella glacialis TaxID=89957 RepID=A0A813D4Z1_POLGL|nr:unnamed protein product [Polarella glacialis]
MSEMPKLNFKRLMVELRQAEKAMQGGQEAWLLKCEPVEDNLMEWDVEAKCEQGSLLQDSLDRLAAVLFDDSMGRLFLRLRFPVEFPLRPPEVWLQRPRMKKSSSALTFGGKIGVHILTSTGWVPSTSIVAVLQEVCSALVEARQEADTAVAVRRDYPPRPPQLERLVTELFPTMNGFCMEAAIAMSPTEAAPFLGDLTRMEVRTQLGRKTHCAIFDFINGLPEGHVLLPKWLMEDIGLEEREAVRVRGVEYVKVQPHSADFYNAVRDTGREVRDLLTESLSRYSALTEDTALPVDVGGTSFEVQVLQLKPRGAVRIIDQDIQHHFEFEVDFEAAPDLEDETAAQAYQARVIEQLKLKRQRSVTERESAEEKRQAARRRHFEAICEKVRSSAGGCVADGDVEVALRLPNGSQLKARVQEGSPVAALTLLVLQSSWAASTCPWGVRLALAFPRRHLKDGELVTRELHRTSITVQEERAPDTDEELFSLLGFV